MAYRVTIERSVWSHRFGRPRQTPPSARCGPDRNRHSRRGMSSGRSSGMSDGRIPRRASGQRSRGRWPGMSRGRSGRRSIDGADPRTGTPTPTLRSPSRILRPRRRAAVGAIGSIAKPRVVRERPDGVSGRRSRGRSDGLWVWSESVPGTRAGGPRSPLRKRAFDRNLADGQAIANTMPGLLPPDRAQRAPDWRDDEDEVARDLASPAVRGRGARGMVRSMDGAGP